MKILTNLFNAINQNAISNLPVFRQKPTLTDDKVTQYRTAAYALIFRDIDKTRRPDVLALKTPSGLFLPGGGVDEVEGLGLNIPRQRLNELCIETIKREVEEEIGDIPVEVGNFIYEAIQIFHSPKAGKVIKMRCLFYYGYIDSARPLRQVSPDGTGHILWLPYPYSGEWFHSAQIHAVISYS